MHSQKQARTVGDGCVAPAGLGRNAGIEDANHVGVKLAQGQKGKIAGAQRGLKTAAIHHYVFADVPIDGTEIEDVFAVYGAHAARASAEAVGEPVEF